MFVGLLGLAAAHATGCVQLNASHCANLQGNATCEERGGGAVCSKCTSQNDGCVETVAAGCEVGVDATESGTTTVDVTGTTAGMSMSSTSVTSSTTVEPETGETTMALEMDVAAMCGDGVLNEGEECDGDQFSVEDCAALDWDGGELGCNQELCVLDTSGCTGGEPPCGDGVRGPGEACDMEDFGDQTCESLHQGEGDPQAYGGEPTCTPSTCEIDRTTCCLVESASCVALLEDEYQCCEGLTCNLLGGGLGTCTPEL